MSELAPLAPDHVRFVIDAPADAVPSILRTVKRVGGLVLRTEGKPAPLADGDALAETIRIATPLQRTALELLLNSGDRPVPRATLAQHVGVLTEKFHTVAWAPFFKRMNRLVAVPQPTLIDRFIESSRTPRGDDVAYRLRPEFIAFVIAGLKRNERS